MIWFVTFDYIFAGCGCTLGWAQSRTVTSSSDGGWLHLNFLILCITFILIIGISNEFGTTKCSDNAAISSILVLYLKQWIFKVNIYFQPIIEIVPADDEDGSALPRHMVNIYLWVCTYVILYYLFKGPRHTWNTGSIVLCKDYLIILRLYAFSQTD